MQPIPREDREQHEEVRRPVERPEAFRRPVEEAPEYYGRPGTALELRRDLIRWGPVLAGVAVALATIVFLSVLGAAIGLGAGPGVDFLTAAGIWSAIVMIIGLFLGGWVAAATSAIGGRLEGAFDGVMVWATLLVIGLILSAIGAGALLGAMTQFGSFGVTPAPGTTVDVVATAWTTFVALLIGLAVAALGGYMGAREQVVSRELR